MVDDHECMVLSQQPAKRVRDPFTDVDNARHVKGAVGPVKTRLLSLVWKAVSAETLYEL